MKSIRIITAALKGVASHPLNRNRKLRAVAEYGFVQVAARLMPGNVTVPFPNGTQLLINPRMKGAAHFIAPRLNEFEEMSFVMHFLRPGDRFADVGANIGAFTVLAAGVTGASVCSFEASPDTYKQLCCNVRLNNLQEKVRAVNAAAGRTKGTISFSSGLGTENCVSAGTGNNSVTVPMTTLDQELSDSPPALMKMDVEGYETEVFGGATALLRNPALRAMIVERGGSGNRYGFDEAALHREIRSCGFIPCTYDPFVRTLTRVADEQCGNIIYVRDLAASNALLKTAKPFRLDDLEV
ncbi:MAG TPA: FkbM family methyltransferase [Candidatus Paceibacterota bacterium]|nr:FkbM family methyltransferase [Candidatus Paceibacterota bacterium]